MGDVAARLAQGLPALENTSAYVSACRTMGYGLLTDAAVRDWYGTEDGLDLTALQSDSEALGAAAAAADDAAQRQANLAAVLAGTWTGVGGSTAHDFLSRQNAAASSVSDALVQASAALSTLRDDLWQAVDAKVNAALDIDDRPSGKQGDWLAAANTVNTGAGDISNASELVDQQVKPFVDHDIGGEWLDEMRSAFERVAAAFDAAITRLGACPAVTFDPLGEATSGWQTGSASGSTVPAAMVPAAMVPAAGDSAPLASAPADLPAAPVAPGAPPSSMPSSLPTMPSPGELGGGMPSFGSGTSGFGSGASGFGQQIADLIGGLLGGSDGAPPDPSNLDVSEPDDPGLDDPGADDPGADDPGDDDPGDDDPGDGKETAEGTDEPKETDAASAESSGDESAPEDPEAVTSEQPGTPEQPGTSEQPGPEPVSTPATQPPAQQPAATEAVTEAATPCEIAAEELPQVGQ